MVLGELADDFVDILDAHIFVDLAHDLIDALHRIHYLGIDANRGKLHRNCLKLGLHLIHRVDLCPDTY